MQGEPNIWLASLGLRPLPEDEAPLRAYLGLVAVWVDALCSVPLGEAGPALTFPAPVPEA